MAETPPQHARAIGEKLRVARKERHMSLRELADKAEMSASMLSQIETGKAFPSVRSLYNIAAMLDVPVDYFFPEQDGNLTISNGSNGNSKVELTASEMRNAKLQEPAETVTEFVAETQFSSPVMQANARPRIELNGGVSWSRLTAFAEEGAEFLEITYEPGASSGAKMSHHEGREFGLILEGELVVELGFESYTLHRGDSIIFESSTPHRLINNGIHPMRAVWVVLSRF
jgi:transcriptional regulator with XRE-family HTH domain